MEIFDLFEALLRSGIIHQPWPWQPHQPTLEKLELLVGRSITSFIVSQSLAHTSI